MDEDEARLARLMANQAALAIEKTRLHEEEVKVQSLEKELAVGREIQLSLLPKSAPEMPGWEWASFYNAAQEVGGDFYDFFRLPGQPRRGHRARNDPGRKQRRDPAQALRSSVEALATGPTPRLELRDAPVDSGAKAPGHDALGPQRRAQLVLGEDLRRVLVLGQGQSPGGVRPLL